MAWRLCQTGIEPSRKWFLHLWNQAVAVFCFFKLVCFNETVVYVIKKAVHNGLLYFLFSLLKRTVDFLARA